MSNFDVNHLTINTCQYQNVKNNSNLTAVQNNRFQETVEKTKQSSEVTNSSAASLDGQDVVMNIPLTRLTTYSVDSNKSKADMTMDEYKKYICNEIANLPASSCFQSQHTGQLIIKDEAFEHMKNDPEYENTVMNMIRGMVSVNHMYAPCYGIQVIGKTMEETYGFGIPIQTAANSVTSAKKKSYWLERHEKMEALYEELEEKAAKLMEEKKAEIEKQKLLQYQEEMKDYQSFLNEKFSKFVNNLETDAATISTQAVSPQFIAKVVNAYESNSYFL